MDYILIGSIAFGAFVLLFSLVRFVKSNYIIVTPDQAAVVSGRKQKISGKDGTTSDIGYRLVTGGGFFRIPILESVKFLNISNRSLNTKVIDAPNKDGVLTTMEGVANVKFSSEKNLLRIAVERFLDKSDTEIDSIILNSLEGHLRAVVGKMTMEALIGDKTALNAAVLEEANDDFNKMGIDIDFVNIQDISDNDNYIKNLGKKRAAEIQRDAEIGSAIAEADSVKRTSGAKREGVEESNKNEVKIAESDRLRDVNKAEMKAIVDQQNEISNQAGPLSQAKAMKAVLESRAETEAANQKAMVSVEEMKALKEEQKYVAEMLVPAEAKKKAAIINAQAEQETKIIQADGIKQSTIREAAGKAEAVLLEKKAEAEGQAAIVREQGMAEADAIEAKLLAEAKGIKEKAEAYAKLDQTGKFLEVLNALQTLAPNMIKEFAGVMAASTAHLGNIKDVKIVDFGGNGKGGSSVGNFGSAPVELITKFAEGASGAGFDISKLFDFIGINKEGEKTVKAIKSDDTEFPEVDAKKE